MAQLTGLPLDVVTQARGFVDDAFVKSLRPDGKIVSRYDATFAVDDPYPELRAARGPDPILDGVSRAYGGAMASYARNELGFKTEMTYALLVRRRSPAAGTGKAAACRPAPKTTCARCSPSARRSAC